MYRLLPLLLFLSFLPALAATDYYVAKDGDDANPGTAAEPFLTLAKAASVVTAGDVCYLKAGVYREVLRPANGGTALAPIVFKAYETDAVTISATEPLTGWRPHAGATYRTDADIDLGRATMIYHEGVPMDWARWPNNIDQDPFTIDAMEVTGGTADRIDAADLPDLDWTGGYVWYLGAHSGTSWTRRITSSAGKTLRFTAVDVDKWPFHPHNPTVFRNGNRGRFYVFGVLGALDAEREWYFDATADRVYFQAPGKGQPADGAVEYAAREHTIFLDQPHVIVEGITTFGGMVEIKGANCILRDSEVLHGYQRLDELDNSDAQDPAGSVWVRAAHSVVAGNLIAGGSHSGISVQGWGGVEDVTLRGNEIREFNTSGTHSSPIRIRSANSRVISNTIVGGGRDGIFAPAPSMEIAWNDVSDVMRINNDGGLFYVVGNEEEKNSSVHHNWFHDSFGPDYADGRCAGIYLDNDSKGYDVHHNVVWNISWTAVQMNWAANDNDIFNNSFTGVGNAMGIWLNGRTQTGNRIWNNYTDVGPWHGQDVADNLISTTNPFRDPEDQDFRPRDGSELVDAGREIPGITTGFNGSAPDIGAYESGPTRWIPGAPRAGRATTAVPSPLAPALRAQLFPNPARAATTLRLLLPRRSDLSWALLSRDGRTVRSGKVRQLAAGDQQLTLSLSSLPAGLYHLVGTTTEGGFRKSLVVE